MLLTDDVLDLPSLTVPVSQLKRVRPIVPFESFWSSILRKAGDVGVGRPEETDSGEVLSDLAEPLVETADDAQEEALESGKAGQYLAWERNTQKTHSLPSFLWKKPKTPFLCFFVPPPPKAVPAANVKLEKGPFEFLKAVLE